MECNKSEAWLTKEVRGAVSGHASTATRRRPVDNQADCAGTFVLRRMQR